MDDIDLAPPEILSNTKKGKKKVKATRILGFVEVPSPLLANKPKPPSPGFAKKPIRDKTQTSASSYLLLGGTTGAKVDDMFATFLSTDDDYDPEM